MWWLLSAARRLREHGVLSMNRRNAEYILDKNPRGKFKLVDDKLALHERCAHIGVPSPRVLAVISRFGELGNLDKLLAGHTDFVIKPNRGAGGRGIIVIVGRADGNYLRAGGRSLTEDQLREHLANILSGLHSLDAHADQAFLQERVRLHPAFGPISYQGIPDVRIVLHHQEPVMAMLRLPTKASGGRANLHQGGIGAGIDLDSGRTHHAVLHGKSIDTHPDSRISLIGRKVPQWQDVLTLSRRVAADVALGYLGVDIVIDPYHGPLLLEANARPGLAIQLANHQGLLPQVGN